MARGILLAACCVLVIVCVIYSAEAAISCRQRCNLQCRNIWRGGVTWRQRRGRSGGWFARQRRMACLNSCYKLHVNCLSCATARLCTRCARGYYLNSNWRCVASVSPCKSNPCQNGGTCSVNGDGTYSCACPEAWNGTNCETSTVLRLVDGPNDRAGRLEVFYNGTWGTVCDDDFDDDDNAARVACNNLGFGYLGWNMVNLYGEGEGPIWLDNVVCYGNEERLEDCAHNAWGVENCDHDEDISIACTERKPDPCNPNPCQNGGTCTFDDTLDCACVVTNSTGPTCELACNPPCSGGQICTAVAGVSQCSNV